METKNVKTFYQNNNTILYLQEQNEEFDGPVLIKTLKSNASIEKDLIRLQNEFENTNAINSPEIRKAIKRGKFDNRPALWLEYIPSTTLNHFLKDHQLDTKVFLQIAINICSAVSKIHQNGIVHKDLNGNNILIKPKTLECFIIDFDTSTRVDLREGKQKNPEKLEGLLTHIAPEQTGRINRKVDYRSDLYSLGVTFYHLISGKLPFEPDDIIKLLHSHIARKATPLFKVDPSIPTAISNIIEKLLAKNAENRYQSCLGLKHDLEVCLKQIEESGIIKEFELAAHDFSGKLQLPQQLLGRDKELKQLKESLDNTISTKTCLTLVTGYAGVGKSALISELQWPISQKNGLLIQGKYDQHLQNIPYVAITEAFSELVDHLLMTPDKELQQWKASIKNAVGDIGQVLIDVIPKLEHIIGKQPSITELGSTEAQHRFKYAFISFVEALCAKQSITLFLDDLQWTDLSSLELIEAIISIPNLKNLFIIGAYRSNEIDQNHPLAKKIDEFRAQSLPFSSITLENLAQDHVEMLIREAFSPTKQDTTKLAKLLYAKAQGNPFFTTQIIQSLCENKIIEFDFGSKNWTWNMTEIQHINITKNVIDLLTSKITNLPVATQEVLKLAACIGNRFKLQHVRNVSDKPLYYLSKALWGGIKEGFIVPVYDPIRYFRSGHFDQTFESDIEVSFQFIHDRVQQAVTSMIPSVEWQEIHLKLGTYFQNLSQKDKKERVFDIVAHYNKALPIIDDSNKVEVARLNAQASKRAKQAAAFEPAFIYAETALAQLDQKIWEIDYNFAFETYKLYAELAYLAGRFERSQEVISEIIEHAQSELDQAAVLELLVLELTMMTQYQQAEQEARNGIALLGFEIPDDQYADHIGGKLGQIAQLLQNRSISSIADDPNMPYSKEMLCISLLFRLSNTAYIMNNQELFTLSILNIVELSLIHGHTPYSQYGYSCYGIVLAGALQDFDSAYAFGEMSIQLAEKHYGDAEQCKALFQMANFMSPWKKPLSDSLPLYQKSFELGRKSGELQFAGYDYTYLAVNSYYAGTNLQKLSEACEQYFSFNEQTKNTVAADVITSIRYSVAFLLNDNADTKLFEFGGVTEQEFLQGCQERQSFAAIINFKIAKAKSLTIYGEFDHALQNLEEAKPLLAALFGTPQLVEFHFYYAIGLIVTSESSAQKEEIKKAVDESIALLKNWADHCPSNFKAKYLLVAALYDDYFGQSSQTIEHFKEASKVALQYEYVQVAGLVQEFAVKFYLKKEYHDFAKIAAIKAHECYSTWGAIHKAKQLESAYPDWFGFRKAYQSINLSNTTYTTAMVNTEEIDLYSVVKASQTLSKEVVVHDLLHKMMEIILENAGAESGYLILKNNAQWKVHAAMNAERKSIDIIDPQTIAELNRSEKKAVISEYIVNFVMRSKDFVRIDDARVEQKFRMDHYLKSGNILSLLCLPLLYKNEVKGILYLENNLTTGAFSEERKDILKMLSSQMAISIENALLYENLENKVKERTQELEHKNSELLALNKEKNGLIHIVAHDLKSPLNHIDGLINIIELSASNLDNDQQDSIEHIKKSTQYLKKMITQILDVEAIDKKQVNIDLNAVDISDITKQIVSEYMVEAGKKEINLYVNIDKALRLEADPMMLQQIITNLLSNAIKFSPKGKTIRIDLEEQKDKIELSIKDEGPGISEADMQKLFGKFQRLSAQPTGGEHSTGLGLSIVKKYTEALNGQVWCESTVGNGACFKVQFKALQTS